MDSDWDLLQRYAATRDQAAFAELVARYVDLVYGAARRMLGGPDKDAEDVVQAVFFLLWQKAGRIHAKGALASWLFRAVRYCCANVKKEERRRKEREPEVAMQRHEATAAPADLAPLLDEALAKLGKKDQQALLIRYLQGRTAEETAAILGLSTAAVEKRSQRGIQKLRKSFAGKGFVVPAAGVAGVMLAEGAKAAPAGLAASAAGVAGAGGANVAAVSIAKGAAVMMKIAMVKLVTAEVAAGVMVFAGIRVAGHLQAQPVAAPAPIAQTEPAVKGNLPATAETAPADSPLAALRDLNKSLEALDSDAIFARLYAFGPDELAVEAELKQILASDAQLKRALVAKFGNKPAAAILPEILGMGLIPEEALQKAELQVTGDAATVTFSQTSGRALLLAKDKNLWKLRLASLVGDIKQEDVPKVIHTAAAAKVANSDAIRLDVENGKLATLAAVALRLKETVPVPAAPAAPAP